MPLVVPHYIRSANIASALVRYRWDDWNVEQAEEPIDETLIAALELLSLRANAAFTIGTAEWIVHRLSPLVEDLLPSHYLASAWAQIIDFRYRSVAWEELAAETEWSGPVRGPVRVAMTRVTFALDQTWEIESPELRAAWIVNLARYVLIDPAPYLEWCERVMSRFQRIYKRNPDDILGEVIPREALDPNFDFDENQTEVLVNQFLAGLDYRSNPFLNSPERMIHRGFEEFPYVFNSEKERIKRLEW